MALLELNSKLERLGRRLKLKNERPWPLRTCLLLAPFTPRFVTRQPALHNAVEHLDHFLFVWLARNLQQQRLRIDSMIDAPLAQQLRNVPQRKRLGDRRSRPPDFLCDV